MSYKGLFCDGMLRKCYDDMVCCHAEQRMKGKVESCKLKVNVEEKATQRGASAYTTWSVEELATLTCPKPPQEADFSVKVFPLCHYRNS